MTPDQLPPGVRVKAPEWVDDGFDGAAWQPSPNDRYSVFLTASSGKWVARYNSNEIARDFTKTQAQAACQRRHEEQVCAQLEIVNG